MLNSSVILMVFNGIIMDYFIQREEFILPNGANRIRENTD